MEILRGKTGTSTVEWLVLAIIVVAVVGGTLYTLFTTLRGKFEGINNAL